MKILLHAPRDDGQTWRAALVAALPEALVAVWPDVPSAIDYALVWKPPPELFARVRPEKVDEYLALMKSDLLPAVKKAGLKDYSLARVRFGAPSSDFLSVAAMDSWADLDGTSWIIRAMGEDGYQRFLAKLRPLRTESEWNIYRYMPDLSYQPTAGGPTSGN